LASIAPLTAQMIHYMSCGCTIKTGAPTPASAGCAKANAIRQRHEDNGRIRYLLDDEEQRLREIIVRDHPEHLPELVIAVGTGQRKSEQYSLEWPQIDFTRREVHLRKTKNGDARDIPMNSDVVAAFQSLMPAGKKPTGRVFAIHDSRVWFGPALAKAEIRDFRWHDCRHTFCSRLAMAGVGLKQIQTMAGHKTIAMTARYSHLSPSTLHSAVELITASARNLARSQAPSATRTATSSKDAKGPTSKPRQK
jgi:integrase